jgi:hypothetical protein
LGVSFLLFPIGGAAALILLSWLADEAKAPAAAPGRG